MLIIKEKIKSIYSTMEEADFYALHLILYLLWLMISLIVVSLVWYALEIVFLGEIITSSEDSFIAMEIAAILALPLAVIHARKSLR